MPNEIHCAHILVKTEKEAQSVLERLKNGEKFTNIASEVSLCPSKKRGGDLGTFGRGRMVREFEQACVCPSERTDFTYSENEIRLPHREKTRIN